MKPVLAIDIDDVLVEHYQLLVDFLNHEYGTQLKPEDVYHHRAIKTIQESQDASRDEIIDKVHSFLRSNDIYIQPLHGAIETIRSLKEKYSMVIISARPEIIQDLTRDWLHLHFPETFNDIQFVGGPGWGRASLVSKRDKLENLGVDILIDDSLRHCEDAVQMGIRGLLFGNYNWNSDQDIPDGITRVRDWRAVTAELL